jgi:hypothetical protein
MPHFLLTFGDASRPPVGAVIVEAPSMFQARMTAVVRRLAPGVPFGEGLKLGDKMIMSILPEQIGRMLSGDEASQLILRLVNGPRQARRMTARRFPPPWTRTAGWRCPAASETDARSECRRRGAFWLAPQAVCGALLQAAQRCRPDGR